MTRVRSDSELMRDLVFGYPTLARSTKEQIVGSDDKRYVAVFLELMRAIQIGIVRELSYPGVVCALTPYPHWIRRR